MSDQEIEESCARLREKGIRPAIWWVAMLLQRKRRKEKQRKRLACRRPWTVDEKKYLTDAWGRLSARTIVENLRRTETAIYVMADKLGLPPQSQGKTSRGTIAKVVGLSDGGLQTLMRECYIFEGLIAPVAQKGSAGRMKRTSVDLQSAEIAMTQRTTRTSACAAYAKLVGVSERKISRRMVKHGLRISPGKGKELRAPDGVYVEILGEGPGLWCAVWKAVIGADFSAVPNLAPWYASLIVHDIVATKRKSPTWTIEAEVTDEVMNFCRGIARSIKASDFPESSNRISPLGSREERKASDGSHLVGN